MRKYSNFFYILFTQAIKSHWNVRATHSHVNYEGQAKTRLHESSIDQEDFYRKEIHNWAGIIQDLLLYTINPKSIHVVFYEELKSDPLSEVRRMLAYLDLPIHEDRLMCLSRNIEGHFHRGKKEKNVTERDWQDLVQVYREVIEETDKTMFNCTGRRLPFHMYEYQFQ